MQGRRRLVHVPRRTARGLSFDRTAPDGTVTRGEAGEVADWIARHPRELVTVKLITAAPPETARADDQEALTLLANALGGGAGHPAPADDTLAPTSTYDQFMAAGRHVVLIDVRGDSGHRRVWRQPALSYRGSHVEVDKDWQDILEEVFLPGTRQRNYDAVKRRGDEVLGRAPGPTPTSSSSCRASSTPPAPYRTRQSPRRSASCGSSPPPPPTTTC
ncbi:hypothetical protein [Streptomyces sp. NPDC058861]|uniref:hypothetical protein n=1 Tax=Streptomyces sp. NPDC058861 TaxID=3346653 RepID=UPI00369AF2DC